MKISVVIPTYNRPEALHKCLNALFDQKGNLSYEIIVVNDGSTVSYDKVIENVKSNISSIPIAFYSQENSGPAKARNYGVEMAQGDYIAFTDDDCAPHPNWLISFMAHAKEGIVLGGHTINAHRDNLYSEASQLLVHFIYAFFKDRPSMFFTSNNLWIPRKAFISAGGFDCSHFSTSAGEDRELCVRMNSLGFALKWIGEAQIDHYHAMDAEGFKGLHTKYGRSGWDFHQRVNALDINLGKQKNFFNYLIKYPWKQSGYSFRERCRLSYLLFLSQRYGRKGYLEASKKSKQL